MKKYNIFHEKLDSYYSKKIFKIANKMSKYLRDLNESFESHNFVIYSYLPKEYHKFLDMFTFDKYDEMYDVFDYLFNVKIKNAINKIEKLNNKRIALECKEPPYDPEYIKLINEEYNYTKDDAIRIINDTCDPDFLKILDTHISPKNYDKSNALCEIYKCLSTLQYRFFYSSDRFGKMRIEIIYCLINYANENMKKLL